LENTCLKIISIIALCGTLLSAQNKYDFREFKNETFTFIKQPLAWEAGDWLKFGVLGGVTVLVAQGDQSVRNEVQKHPGYLNSIPIQAGYYWGVGYPTAILAVGFGLHGWLDDNNSTKKIGFEIVQATLYAELAKSIFSVSVGRSRPYNDRGPGVFRPFTLLDGRYQSFPGGHATAAFALSTVLAGNTNSILLKILAFAPSGLTVIARVYEDSHWTSDQVFGSVIGIAVASWVVNLHNPEKSRVRITSVSPPTLSITF
jgi:membrane-associated phospholipid phosphatase